MRMQRSQEPPPEGGLISSRRTLLDPPDDSATFSCASGCAFAPEHISPAELLRRARGRSVLCRSRAVLVPRPVGELLVRPDVRLAGALEVVEPLERHAPVLVLVDTHVVVVVPGQVSPSP